MRFFQNKKNVQKRVKRGQKKGFWRRILAFSGLFLALLTLFLVFSDTLFQRVDSFINSTKMFQKESGFKIEEVLLEGRSQTNKQELLEKAGVRVGDPILSFSIQDVHEKLLTLPWVKEVQVERHLPDLIIIRLTEFQPLALWQQGGKLSLISQDETELKVSNPEQYAHLPKVIGKGALKKAKSFLMQLQTFPRLWNDFQFAQYISQRRWSVVLKNKKRIEFPEMDVEKSIEKLKRYDRKHKALDRFRVIDLRLPDKVTVKK